MRERSLDMGKPLAISILFLTSFSQGQIWKQYVPEGAIRIENRFYKFVESPGITWVEADRQARAQRGQLAVFPDNRGKWNELWRSNLPPDVYMWIGHYHFEDKIAAFNGEVHERSGWLIDYSASMTLPGYLFLAPCTSYSSSNVSARNVGKFIVGIENFPMDGYLCEWILDEDEGLIEAPPTVPVKDSFAQEHAETEEKKILAERFKSGADERDFTSTDGKTLRGVIQRVDGKTVVVRSSEFETFRIPRDRFSADDQSEIEKHAQSPSPGVEVKFEVEGKITSYPSPAIFVPNIRPQPGVVGVGTPNLPMRNVARVTVEITNSGSVATSDLFIVVKMSGGFLTLEEAVAHGPFSIAPGETHILRSSPSTLVPQVADGGSISADVTVGAFQGGREIASVKSQIDFSADK